MIDTQNKDDFNVVVDAKYIIVRGLLPEGRKAFRHIASTCFGRELQRCHDVIIEDNGDISEWETDEPSCAGKAFVHGTNLASRDLFTFHQSRKNYNSAKQAARSKYRSKQLV